MDARGTLNEGAHRLREVAGILSSSDDHELIASLCSTLLLDNDCASNMNQQHLQVLQVARL